MNAHSFRVHLRLRSDGYSSIMPDLRNRSLSTCPSQALLLSVMMWCTFPATACPVCDSETGDAVRQGIFDDVLASNIAAAVLPFIVLAGIVGAVHFSPDATTRATRATRPRGKRP